jgi:DNA primase
MLHERLTFVEAVAELAKRAGLELQTESQPQRNPQQEQGLQSLQQAAEFYRQRLQSPAGQAAQEYLRQRQVPPSWQEKFLLGYAPDEWQALLQHLEGRGIAVATQEQAGLVKASDRSDRRYDRFRQRLMFPIRDARGRCIGFGGRVIHKEDQPKYLNSPESSYYKKSQVLYGLYEGMETIRRSRELIFVEGYLDVIRMHEFGFAQAVATCGTALTPEHVQLIRRYANSIVLLFDGDAAGRKAALKNCQLFLPFPLDVYILTLPEGEDPDTFLLHQGAEAFQSLLTHKQPLLEFLVQHTLAKYPETVPGQQEALQELLPTVQQIAQLDKRQMTWVRISELLRIPTETIFALVKKLTLPRESRKEADSQNAPASLPPEIQDERWLLQALLSEEAPITLARQFLRVEDFRHPLHRQLYERLLQLPDDAFRPFSLQQLTPSQSELDRELASLYTAEFPSQHAEAQFRFSLRRLKARRLAEHKQEQVRGVERNSLQHAMVGRRIRQLEEELNQIYQPR